MYPTLPFTRSLVNSQHLIDSFIVFLISFHQLRFTTSDEFEPAAAAHLISLLQLFYFDSSHKKKVRN